MNLSRKDRNLFFNFTKQGVVITPRSRRHPFLRNKLPLIQRTRLNLLLTLDILHQIITQILVGGTDDAFHQLILGNARPFRQQLDTTIATV